MIRVVNLGNKAVDFTLYIGRANRWRKLPASKWANPFVIGKDGTRAEVIEKYREYVLQRPDLVAALPELDDQTLGCWCHPEACHGDVLVQLHGARCLYCSQPLWEHEWVGFQWEAGEDWSQHVWTAA